MNLNTPNIQLSLDDFRSQDIFVLLRSTYKNNLLKKAIFKAGSQSKLATIIKENIDYSRLKQSVISSFVHKKNLRLDLIYFLCKFTDIKFDEKQTLGIKGVQTSRMIYNPEINISLTIELAQILANLYCDGSIEKNNCYVSTYINGCEELIDGFKNNFKLCFGDLDYYERYTHVKNVRIPCFIGKLLYYKFRLYEDRISSQIIHSSRDVKAAYLQAAFDDEGTIHKTHGQIRIKMKPKSYIKDVQKLIQGFDIETSKVIEEYDKRNGRKYYYFLISGMYNSKKFHDEIGFFHPKKKKRLIKHLRNIKTENYGYKAKNIVFDILKKHKSSTTKQIAKLLKRDKRVIHQHLTNLKKKNLVSFTKLKRKFVYEYLWKVI
ncbi:MAG: hypothetical protein IH934_02380 [Nanoarchaeota archaeon]|nr:hypothetical protein [Nanoarchaeota archaeon]